MGQISLSTVIVAHDSVDDLRRALPPLVAQLGPTDELIVVDNASRDGIAGELPPLAPQARLLTLEKNVGFAAGANRGVEMAGGDLIVLLNPDAVVHPGWAEAIRAPAGDERWAAWMGLVLMADGAHVNTSGGTLHFTGFGWAGQIGEPLERAPREEIEVAFASGACLAIPRATWEAIGGFPEHFFMYCEDVDLSLKLRLCGGRLGVVPAAKVSHGYTFAKGGHKWRRLERNRWATMIRTYPLPLLLAVLPALVVTEVAVWAVAVRGGWAAMKGRSTLDLVNALPTLLRERQRIQRSRKVSAASFAAALTPDLGSPYFGSIGSHRLIRATMRAYWKVVSALLRERSA